MRLVDAIFVAALIAKKRRLQSALRPAVEKGASMPLATTARGNSSGGKVRCTVPRRSFQKKWPKGLVFYKVCDERSSCFSGVAQCPSAACLLVGWHKAGLFVPMPIGIGFCTSALSALQMCLTWFVGH